MMTADHREKLEQGFQVRSFWKCAVAALAMVCGALAIPDRIQAQGDLEWTTPAPVALFPGMTAARPRVATDGVQVFHESHWVTVWESPGSDAIFASHSNANGDAWRAPQELFLVSEESGERHPEGDRPQASRPDIAGGSLGGIFVAVWEAATTTGLEVNTWDKSDIGVAVFRSRSDPAFEFSGLPLTAGMLGEDDTSSEYAPSVATDNGGTWMVVWRSVDKDDVETTDPVVVRLKGSISTNQGTTWSDPIIIAENVHLGAEPVIRSNGAGQWLVVWSDINPDKDVDGNGTGAFDIYSSLSMDNGQTWGSRVSIHSDGDENYDDTKPRLTFTPDQGWVAVWTRVEGPTVQHILSGSMQFPPAWTDGAPVATNIDASSQGDVAVASDGRAATVVTWGQNLGSRIINYSVSLNGGASWGPAGVLADNAPALSQPAIASDLKGKWVAVMRTGEPGAPFYSTTFLPIPGQPVADMNIKEDFSIFQPPTEPDHPVYTDIPMELTVRIENRGPDPATDSGVWLWALKGDFELHNVSIPGKSIIVASDEVGGGTIERFKVTLATDESIAPGETQDVIFTLLPLQEGTRPMLFTTFSVYDPYLLDNEMGLLLSVFERPPLADLKTTLRSYPESEGVGNGGFIGSPMALIVEVTNQGESDAEAVLLDEILEELVDGPGGTKIPAFTFNYAASTQGSWRYERMPDGRGRILCTFGTIPVGRTATLVIAITPTEVGVFGHHALARSADLKTLDMTPEDARASGVFKVTNRRVADVGVALTTSNANPELNAPFTLTATLTNHGDAGNTNGGTAFHPRLILNVPQGAEVLSVHLPAGSFSRSSTGPIICGLRALRGGASATLTVQVVMRSPMNVAITAEASNTGAEDPNPSNNISTVNVQSGGTGQLQATERTAGENVTYGTVGFSHLPVYMDSAADRSDRKVRKRDGKSKTSRQKARKQIEAKQL